MALTTASTASLKASGVVGAQETDVATGRSLLDEDAAALLAGDAGLAGQPLPLESALACVHPEDRGWVFEKIRRVRRTGGSFAAEFRVQMDDAEIRLVLNRGVLTSDAKGRMRGRGAYIDTTDSHRDPSRPPTASIRAQPACPSAEPLEAAAEHCLQAHAAIARTDDAGLLRLVKLLLLGVGRALARRQQFG